MKDYNEIENALQNRYDNLLSAVKAPDTDKKPKIKTSKLKNLKEFFDSTGFQVAAAAVALVLTVGGVYGFIFYFGGKNINNNPPATDTEITDTERSPDTQTEYITETKDVVTDAESTDAAATDVLRIIAETDGGALFAGDDAFLYIRIENVKDLASLCLTVTWDERLTLDFADYAKLSGLKNVPDDEEWSEVGNSFTFNWVALDPIDALNSDFTFVTLKFATPGESGDYPVTITANPDNIFDNNDQNVPYTIKNTAINTVDRELTVPDDTTALDTEPVITDTEPVTETDPVTETEPVTETDPVVTDTDPVTTDTDPVTETGPVTTDTEPVGDNISNYLHYYIVDPSEDESGLTQQQFGNEKFAVLNGIDECSFDTVELPDTYNGYKVKKISKNALFSNIKGLKYLYMPAYATVENGGPFSNFSVFKGCDELVEVTLPENMTKIPESLFRGCESLQKVIMPAGLETIGDYAFYECKNLRINTVPSTVKIIGGGAFLGCKKITTFTLPYGIEQLGGEAFRNCSNLKEINFPDTLMAIGGECFCYTSLKSVVIPQNKQYQDRPSFGVTVFAGCTQLEHVELPEGMIDITWQMFNGCQKLAELELPQSIETVNLSAFNNTGIKKIKLGKYVHTVVNGNTTVTDLSNYGIEIELDPDSKYIAVENNIIIPIYDLYTINGGNQQSVYEAELDCFVDYLSDSIKNKYTRKFFSEMTDEYKASLDLPANYMQLSFEELFNYISWLKPAADDPEFEIDRIRLSYIYIPFLENREAEVNFYVSDGLNHKYEVTLSVRRNDEIWQIVSVKNIKL